MGPKERVCGVVHARDDVAAVLVVGLPEAVWVGGFLEHTNVHEMGLLVRAHSSWFTVIKSGSIWRGRDGRTRP